MAFKDVIRNLRKQEGMTQAELGRALGISKSTISMYECGKREPDFETLELVADYFNVDMNHLMGWKDETFSAIRDGYLSPSDISYELGLPEQVVSDVLANPQNASPEVFNKLCQVGALLVKERRGSPVPADDLTALEWELVHRYRRAPQEIRTIVDTALSPYGEQSANPASSEQSVG